jgi:GNAT superfamily N-acetyltransferase
VADILFMEPSEKKPGPKGKKPSFKIVGYESLSPEQKNQLVDLKAGFIRRYFSDAGEPMPEKIIASLARSPGAPGSRNFAALEGGRLVGYLALVRFPEGLLVDELFSLKERQGIGTALLAKAISVARGKKCDLILSKQSGAGLGHFSGLKARYEASRLARGVPLEMQKLVFLPGQKKTRVVIPGVFSRLEISDSRVALRRNHRRQNPRA